MLRQTVGLKSFLEWRLYYLQQRLKKAVRVDDNSEKREDLVTALRIEY